MDFNFRAPSPMFKEMNRLESPSLFFDDFKIDVNVSPSRFFTTTPPLWSPTKSLQESSSPTKSLLTNESPTFNCFVDNIQPNGLIPFKPQVVKLEESDNSFIGSNNVNERTGGSGGEENTQHPKNPLLHLESKGGAFEKFNNPVESNIQPNPQQISFLNSAFSKIENKNVPETNPFIKQENNPFTTGGNNNRGNLQQNHPPLNNPNMMNNTNNNPNNQPKKNMMPPSNFNNTNNFQMQNPQILGNSAFSKHLDNMPLYNQSLLHPGFPNNNPNNVNNNVNNMNNMNNNVNKQQQQGGFHPHMMQMNPAMMQQMQMQMQMQQNPNNPTRGDSRFFKFESVVPMMNTNEPKNPLSHPNFNNNPNNLNNMNNINNMNNNLNNNNNPLFLSVTNHTITTRSKNPLDKSTDTKLPPNKKQKSKRSTEPKTTSKPKDNKLIKPKFTTEINKTNLEQIEKKRHQDLQSPTFTDDGHLKNRVKEKKEVPDKIQCLGSSKKKGTQCKNAALLEFIGPRPLYCAEHIEEDKNTLHGKCKCPYFKEKGDGKPCKQIILKELVMCYRHFDEVLPTLTLEKARRQKTLVVEMIKKLRQDSKTFLKTNIDLYQRKSKLLPKYIKLDNTLAKFIAEKEKETE